VLLQDELPNGAAGLHKRDDNKQPFALVALTTNWPVFMSHEVFEMVVDPQGNLTRAGNSLKSGQRRVRRDQAESLTKVKCPPRRVV
jgi:hypothetical protein